ncbi:hypothetical protein LTR62_001588 [Meristemomyces frigidus]|uniref:Major facilitator superfamily (MFS) profile domain-containing protein n=1 Tax=Meristemomyces frigidus TaxID=1508187 RepID=A0AAN7YBL0_9PEZI|nr:hypothetical protein LTR62_001588 [Meristemomyces frigidus]
MSSRQQHRRTAQDAALCSQTILPRLAHRTFGFLDSIGLVTVYTSTPDVKLILAQRFIRTFAYGLVALLLAAYLDALGISETHIGVFFGLTLVGDLFMVMALTQVADVVGRRAILVLGAVLMTMSGLVFAFSGNYWVLLTAAVLGVISPSATEVGPFKSIEESALFTTVKTNLVDVLSWYSTAEFASVAAGLAVSGAIMEFLQDRLDWNFVQACRVIFLVYAGVGLMKVILSSNMSSRIESWYDQDVDVSQEQQLTQTSLCQGDVEAEEHDASEHEPFIPSPSPPAASNNVNSLESAGVSIFSLDRHERLLLMKLCGLFAIDSCAVGLSSVPWQTYMVRTRFKVTDAQLGLIFMMANGFGALGTISSSLLARSYGNLITLAITLTPSAVFLCFFGFANTIQLMLLLIVTESFLSPIYLAPRNAFISQILTKSKRTASLGIITICKLATNATGSFLTGFWADRDMFWLAFLVAGSLKMIYVGGMLYTFLAVDRRIARVEKQREVEQHGVQMAG